MDKWDRRFIDMTALVSTWSKDPSTGCGAVIVDPKNRIVSIGFNGFPQKVRDDLEIRVDRQRKLMRTIHAEENAILFANRSLEGCSIYVSAPPCAKCTAKIIQVGIDLVVFRRASSEFMDRWGDEVIEAMTMFSEARVIMRAIG